MSEPRYVVISNFAEGTEAVLGPFERLKFVYDSLAVYDSTVRTVAIYDSPAGFWRIEPEFGNPTAYWSDIEVLTEKEYEQLTYGGTA